MTRKNGQSFLGIIVCAVTILFFGNTVDAAHQKPYTAPAVEREAVFEFTKKPKVRNLGKDRYEIMFAVKGKCDVTVGMIDEKGVVVRHIGSGVLGANAPQPFQKNSLKQTLYWDGKDDFEAYVKDVSKLKVRVMLGMKPEFHRNLGNNSPYDIPGWVQGLAGDEDGMYVFSLGHKGRMFLRKFGHDLKYQATLSPPPANLPPSKLEGMGYVEYEPGKRAVHHHDAYETIARNGSWLSMKGGPPQICRPAAGNGRIYYPSKGFLIPAYFYYINNDGSTDLAGCSHRRLFPEKLTLGAPTLAASPNGKWIYLADKGNKNQKSAVVWRIKEDSREPAAPFIGKIGKPGSDNRSLNGPTGIDCDSKGRIYVADGFNNRVQVFSPDGKFLETLKVNRPEWVGIHRKTGAVYVLGGGAKRGSGLRITKHSPYPDLKKQFHFDGIHSTVTALDSWSPNPRIWTAIAGEGKANPRSTVWVWEEQSNNKGFKLVFDFHKEGQRIAGANSKGYWHGSIRNKLAIDGRRERVYLSHNKSGWFVFDLPTGNMVELVSPPGNTDDIDFDKKGYMHAHFNPGSNQRGVGRFDPENATPTKHPNFDYLKTRKVRYAEIPYNYGIIGNEKYSKKYGLKGILDVMDQPGSKHFQDGLGVNMRGDVAEECNIWYAPKFDDIGKETVEGIHGRQSVADALARGRGRGSYSSVLSYESMKRNILEQEKRGIRTAVIPRMPGVPITGATVWTFDSTGELRDEWAVIAGNLINGVRIDEDGKLYYTLNRQRLYDRKVFLAGKQGVFGSSTKKQHPFMGTYVKSAGKGVRVLIERSVRAPVPLDQKPDRPPEVGGYGTKVRSSIPGETCWVEGAEWFYAGASPIVVAQPCSCYTMRCALDWYKRSYVLEQYRHSIAILDTNGNLIMRMGRYGNFDSGHGAKSKIPVGGDNLAISFCENVAASDNYICYEDNGERLTAVKINYHAEATANVSASVVQDAVD